MSSNFNGKRPMGNGADRDRGQSKRPRTAHSISPEPLERRLSEPSRTSQIPDTVPEAKPDIGINTFLYNYLATHTADDPMFRQAITQLVETKFDNDGIDYADELLEEIKSKGGQHPNMSVVQTISDQECGFKFARMMMSVALEVGNLHTTMLYLGKIAADRFGVQLSNNFENLVQQFLVEVGHSSTDANNAAAHRQMSVMPMDAREEANSQAQNGGQQQDVWQHANSDDVDNIADDAATCRKRRCCTCIPGEERRLAPSITREQRLELFTSSTPLIDLILGRKATLATTLTNLKTQRVTITNCLRARAGQLNCHKLQVSELRTLYKLSTRDEWYDSLVKAYKSPLFRRKDSVEKVLHQFADGNRCLFPELRRFDKKRQNIKKERA